VAIRALLPIILLPIMDAYNYRLLSSIDLNTFSGVAKSFVLTSFHGDRGLNTDLTDQNSLKALICRDNNFFFCLDKRKRK